VGGLAADSHAPVVYTNLVGGQDELVFDGQSIVADADGTIIAKAEAFKEDLLVVDIPIASKKSKGRGGLFLAHRIELKTQNSKLKTKKSVPLKTRKAYELSPDAEVYEALKLGLHDYIVKNGFKKVVVGLSGGIDSSLVAVIAADAIGKENVVGVSMPSRYTSDASMADAKELADNIPIKLLEVPIEKIYSAYLAELSLLFEGLPDDITEENIQARIRGNILMALSNKFGWLVLTTGNKSEISVGYATLYGDMAGGFAVIKDVPKTLVYILSRYRNSISHIIPESVLTKAPTAELKPEQKDQDTLPPYDILDRILEDYIEKDKSGEKIVSPVFHSETVFKTLRMVDLSEYKRRQSPPGIKITPKSFGKDRRMPITNRYRG
jgi:NAD+ synthase (glutamine-hydrolysing)